MIEGRGGVTSRPVREQFSLQGLRRRERTPA